MVKVKNIVLSLLIGLLIPAIVLLNPAPRAQAEQGPNLFTNPSFEGGWYDVEIGQVPNGWQWHWLDNVRVPGSDRPALRPESRVLPMRQIPDFEHDIYFLDGEYCIKIFKPEAPIYVALSQDVHGLEVGRQYRIEAPVFVDTYDWDEQKVPPGDPYSARVRLGAGPTGSAWMDEGAISYSAWWDGGNTSPFFLVYTTYTYEFVATAPDMTVYIEMYCKWGLNNNGFFLDDMALYPLGVINTPTPTPPPPPPTNTPGPSPTPLATPTPRPDGAIVHIVQSGDTLYAIATQYNVPVEQIEALNVGSIPANKWLTVGQELVIAIPDNAPTAVPPTQAPAAETPVPTVAVPEATAVPASGDGGEVCVLVYNDRNGDTFRQEDTEERLPNATVTLRNDSGVVGEYITDALSEPYCFANLTPGTYLVSVEPPVGYAVSGQGEVYVALGAAGRLDVALGAARGEAAPAPDDAEPGEDTPDDAVTTRTQASWLVWGARIGGIVMLLTALAAAVLYVISRR